MSRTDFHARGSGFLVFLLALLATACGEDDKPTYGDRLVEGIDRGKVTGARGDLQSLAVAITQYSVNEGQLPDASDMEELADLLSPAYIRRVPKQDPWGTAYHYETDGDSYVLQTAGDDMEWDTKDDLILENGQITQVPEGFGKLGR